MAAVIARSKTSGRPISERGIVAMKHIRVVIMNQMIVELLLVQITDILLKRRNVYSGEKFDADSLGKSEELEYLTS
jgi:hypothetical protein